MADLSPNAKALLETIRFAEGTPGTSGYGTMFGGGKFDWRQGHPNRVVSSGGYSSAAAGAYQFMPDTWAGVAKQIGADPRDFSPAAQDRAALQLIRNRGVDPDQPLTSATLEKLAPEWASLPTRSGKSYYGQPVKGLQELRQAYARALKQQQPAAITGVVVGGAGDELNALLAPVASDAFDPLSAASVIGLNRFAGGQRFAQELAELDPGILAVQAMFGSPRQQLAEPASNAGAISSSGDREAVPSYSQGALKPIEYLTGDRSHEGYRADHGGGNYHEHLAFSSTAERDAAMARLKAAGIQIGSVNDGKHAPGSYHYQDLAFDVPAAQVAVGQEQALSRRVRAILGMA